jgi:hypothetical protein
MLECVDWIVEVVSLRAVCLLGKVGVHLGVQGLGNRLSGYAVEDLEEGKGERSDMGLLHLVCNEWNVV